MELPIINETEMEQHALELLDSLAVTTLSSVRTEVGPLRRTAAIGGNSPVVARGPDVVLLDEPTAALGVSQTEQVLSRSNASASAASAWW